MSASARTRRLCCPTPYDAWARVSLISEEAIAGDHDYARILGRAIDHPLIVERQATPR